MYNVQNFFFRQDIDENDKEIVSFSIGELWLYFHKERLIGSLDISNKTALVFDPEKSKDFSTPEGYTSAHEITAKTMAKVIEDMDVSDITKISDYTDLTQRIFGLASAKMVEETVDEIIPRNHTA